MTTNLIEALEKAEGPSRELDEQIAKVLGLFPSSKDWKLIYKKERIWRRFPYGGDKYTWKEQWEPEYYTASMDAALTFVPDGWKITELNFLQPVRAWLSQREKHLGVCGEAKTAPLAICMAALRARENDNDR